MPRPRSSPLTENVSWCVTQKLRPHTGLNAKRLYRVVRSGPTRTEAHISVSVAGEESRLHPEAGCANGCESNDAILMASRIERYGRTLDLLYNTIRRSRGS
jgi:hypothetical protein